MSFSLCVHNHRLKYPTEKQQVFWKRKYFIYIATELMADDFIKLFPVLLSLKKCIFWWGVTLSPDCWFQWLNFLGLVSPTYFGIWAWELILGGSSTHSPCFYTHSLASHILEMIIVNLVFRLIIILGRSHLVIHEDLSCRNVKSLWHFWNAFRKRMSMMTRLQTPTCFVYTLPASSMQPPKNQERIALCFRLNVINRGLPFWKSKLPTVSPLRLLSCQYCALHSAFVAVLFTVIATQSVNI